jgi:thiamine-monophosphate kinase
MVAVTVLGTVDGGIPVPRHAAVEGDAIFVTGPCGGSAAGLRVLRAEKGAREGAEESARKGAEKSARKGAGRGDESVEAVLAAAYRRPRARLAEGEVARLAGAHAMIDVSDGLALDLHRLADASGVGFVLDTVPVAEGATPDEALGGGEDYELVVVIAPCDIEGYAARCAGAGLRPPLRIGVVRADPAERRLGDDVLGRLGWQHTLG